MEPRIELLRPLNSAMGAVAVAVGALVAAGQPILGSPRLASVGLAMLVAFLYTGAGNALNDYCDRFSDRVNHPRRPIPSKRIGPESARKFSVALFASGLIAALFIGWPDINWMTLLIAALNCLLLAAYEMRLKVRGFPGNLTVSWLTASLFLFGGAAAGPVAGTTVFPAPVLALALLAFLSSVGREIIKGIEDLKGDRDRRTVPRIVGTRAAGMMAGLWIGMAVALSPLPVYPLGIFPAAYYLPTVLAADAIFIYSVWVVFQKPGTASTAAKLAMLLALVAFLLGALTVR
jgi:geranylgeranylglycerol-phosphate geranylgeranyltransferase